MMSRRLKAISHISFLVIFFSFQVAFGRDGCRTINAGCANNKTCGGKTDVSTDLSTQVLIDKLHSQKKFFGHHDLYSDFVHKMTTLLHFDSPEERLIALAEILDPDEEYTSLDEAFYESLVDMGFNSEEIKYLNSILN